MRFKLDENLGSLGKALLESDGHNVMTVAEQNLCGIPDERLYQVCKEEDRILITLDRDFSEVLRFPPGGCAGIIVLQVSGRMSSDAINSRIAEAARLLRTRAVDRHLWIVEPGRIRIRQPR